MSLTRSLLKSIGVDGDKIDPIIEAHVETVEGLKSKIQEANVDAQAYQATIQERDSLKAQLEKANKSIEAYKGQVAGLNDITAERDSLKSEVEALNGQIAGYTEKETAVNAELAGLKEQITNLQSEKTTASAEAEKIRGEFDAFKAQIESSRANAEKKDAIRAALMNGGVSRSDFQDLIVNSMNLDEVTLENGAIKDVEGFLKSTMTKYPSCFAKVEEGGTPPINPVGGAPSRPLTIEDIKKMSADEINKNWAAVQAAMKRSV